MLESFKKSTIIIQGDYRDKIMNLITKWDLELSRWRLKMSKVIKILS